MGMIVAYDLAFRDLTADVAMPVGRPVPWSVRSAVVASALLRTVVELPSDEEPVIRTYCISDVMDIHVPQLRYPEDDAMLNMSLSALKMSGALMYGRHSPSRDAILSVHLAGAPKLWRFATGENILQYPGEAFEETRCRYHA